MKFYQIQNSSTRELKIQHSLLTYKNISDDVICKIDTSSTLQYTITITVNNKQVFTEWYTKYRQISERIRDVIFYCYSRGDLD